MVGAPAGPPTVTVVVSPPDSGESGGGDGSLGVALGVALGCAVLVGIGFLLWRRRQDKAKALMLRPVQSQQTPMFINPLHTGPALGVSDHPPPGNYEEPRSQPPYAAGATHPTKLDSNLYVVSPASNQNPPDSYATFLSGSSVKESASSAAVQDGTPLRGEGESSANAYAVFQSGSANTEPPSTYAKFQDGKPSQFNSSNDALA